jgi:hypothetical protein
LPRSTANGVGCRIQRAIAVRSTAQRTAKRASFAGRSQPKPPAPDAEFFVTPRFAFRRQQIRVSRSAPMVFGIEPRFTRFECREARGFATFRRFAAGRRRRFDFAVPGRTRHSSSQSE